MERREIWARALALQPDGFPAGRAIWWPAARNAPTVADSVHRSRQPVFPEHRPVCRVADEIEALEAEFSSEPKAVLERAIGTEQLPRRTVLDARGLRASLSLCARASRLGKTQRRQRASNRQRHEKFPSVH